MSDEPDSKADESKPPKIRAEDNPWYLLATLYGVPIVDDQHLRDQNRSTWNRYFASNLHEETRTKLIGEKRHTEGELTPFSPQELRAIEAAFAERCKASGKEFALPVSEAGIDFSNVEFKQIAWFVGYLFSSGANFGGATFSGAAFFDGAAFSLGANFGGATFSNLANFGGATFSGGASFDRATFSLGASFGSATFSGGATFCRATFSVVADFEGATFSGRVASFDRATFSGGAHFDGATFSDTADFEGATFSGEAYFHGATFCGMAFFYGAIFSLPAYFKKATFFSECSFINVEMKAETSFEAAIFKTEPPCFFGAKLHQGTIWRGVTWPKKPEDKEEAGDFIDAYACLKLEMDRLKKHEDELDFFVLELQSREVLLGRWEWGLPTWLYGRFSDYGRSYFRPLVALFYLALIGTLAFLTSDSLTAWQSLGLSWANTFNVFGFRKDFFDPKIIADLPGWLDVVAALQTIFGTIFLFLIGLGIRNKFRMK